MGRTGHDEDAGLVELRDLFTTDAWSLLLPRLLACLRSVPAGATVLDLGAGTGLGSVGMARVTDWHVVAAEPSPVARAALAARVAAADLDDRVTVVPGGAPDVLDEVALLGERPAAAVLAHVVGHLDDLDRRATLRRAVDLVAPGGPVVLTVQGVGGPAVHGAVVRDTTRRGRLTYEVTHSCPGPGAWSSTYVVRRPDGSTLREHTSTGHWQAVDLDDVRRDLAGTDASVEPAGPGLVVVRSRGVH